MAKQQDLSLNPSKLSGLCGRLKCCLRYELPNAKGVAHGGCGSEGGCDNPSGCGSGGCGSGGRCGAGGWGGRRGPAPVLAAACFQTSKSDIFVLPPVSPPAGRPPPPRPGKRGEGR